MPHPNPKECIEKGVFFSDYSQVPHDLKLSERIKASMFPNFDPFKAKSEEEKAAMAFETETAELKKCRRFLPHLMNPGGFFATILEKVAERPSNRELKGKTDKVREAEAEADENVEKSPPLKRVKVAEDEAQKKNELDKDVNKMEL